MATEHVLSIELHTPHLKSITEYQDLFAQHGLQVVGYDIVWSTRDGKPYEAVSLDFYFAEEHEPLAAALIL